MRRATLLSLAIALLIALSMAASGCFLSADTEAQLNTAVDFTIGVLTGDADLVRASILPSVEEEYPGAIDNLPSATGLSVEDFTRAYEDGVMTVSAEGQDVEFSLDPDAQNPVVVYGGGSAAVRLHLVETDDGWRVASVDGDEVGPMLEAMGSVSGQEQGSDEWEAELTCHTNQLLFELGTSVYVASSSGQAPSSIDDLIPDYVEELYFCPDPASQYSQENADDGYFGGLYGESQLEPCSVHGHHSESENF